MRRVIRCFQNWRSGSLVLSVALTGTAWADEQTHPVTQKAAPPAAATPLTPVVPVPVLVSPNKKAMLKGSLYHPDWQIFNAGSNVASGFGVVSGYGQTRWSEDWSDLARTPANIRKNDWFNRLKYVRLNDSGSIWMSFGGEERLRYIFENQPMQGQAGKTNASRVLLRNQYGADLHLGEHVRAYAEFLYGVAGGSNTYGYQTGAQRESLDLQQGILEVKGRLLGAQMGVIGGRQVFLDAPVSMQSPRDLTNVQQTWDGFRGYAVWNRFRIDLFDFMQTNKLPQKVFADGTNYNARLYGAYTSTALPSFQFMGQKSQMFADVFFLGYLYGGAAASIPAAAPGSVQKGSSRRDNVGMRLWGNVGPFSTSLTGIFQGGEFRPAKTSQSTRSVRAYAVNGSITYTRSDWAGKPGFGVQGDLFSGGSDRSQDGAVGTFSTPFVPLPYYNDLSLSLTSQNLIGVGPIANFTMLPTLHLKLHVPVFWRASTQDAIYGGNGKIYNWRNNLHGGFTGVMPYTQLSWNFAPHWAWTHDIEGILLSRGMRDVGAKEGALYMQTLEFKF
ncbi:hypothetical protein AD951_03390 [Acetobacter malorum]|uniref:Alginate export domain-containing protein n=1 Tax=Acetobacter malorum TaxID=178901 RepID=A0A149UQR1_9PROT|nr:alginate export family protein [Acetobacter malorum]KXV70257.1 hypothetical protein AD951_03390 [Acetobacter malorum]